MALLIPLLAGLSCPGWQKIDNNPASFKVVAFGTTPVQSRNSCSGWIQIGGNPSTINIVSDG